MTERKRVTEAKTERVILKNLIISKKFCEKVLTLADHNLFHLPYASKIILLTRTFYEKYEDCPGDNIRELIKVNSKDIKPESLELINDFLDGIDPEERINEEYEEDKALTYFQKRNLEVHAESVKNLVVMERLGEAEQRIRDYQKVAKATSKWKNPLNEDHMIEVFQRQEEKLLRLPGKLGQTLGPLERGWLVAVMGPMKRGKTFWLMEFGIHGILEGLKVAFISAEMTFEKMSDRIYKRLLAMADEKGKYIYPVFDCKKNQLGTCEKEERKNTHILYEEGDDPPEFDSENPYRVCVACRKGYRNCYEVATWYEEYEIPKLTYKDARRKINAIRDHYGDNLRIICYPRFSASMLDVEMDLQNLEYTEDFIPDVIITDYADIFKAEGRLEGRDALDNIWKHHARLAGTRHCLVVTGSQTNKASLEKKVTKITDVSEDVRKLAHVDAGIFLSQTNAEKKKYFMRLSFFHRHKFFDDRQIQVLQQLDVGQVLLDSEYYK